MQKWRGLRRVDWCFRRKEWWRSKSSAAYLTKQAPVIHRPPPESIPLLQNLISSPSANIDEDEDWWGSMSTPEAPAVHRPPPESIPLLQNLTSSPPANTGEDEVPKSAFFMVVSDHHPNFSCAIHAAPFVSESESESKSKSKSGGGGLASTIPLLQIPIEGFPIASTFFPFGSKIYMIGGHFRGYSFDPTTPKVYAYDTNDFTFSEAPPMNSGKSMPLVVSINGLMYVLNHNLSQGPSQDSMFECFNSVTHIWTKLPSPPVPFVPYQKYRSTCHPDNREGRVSSFILRHPSTLIVTTTDKITYTYDVSSKEPHWNTLGISDDPTLKYDPFSLTTSHLRPPSYPFPVHSNPPLTPTPSRSYDDQFYYQVVPFGLRKFALMRYSDTQRETPTLQFDLLRVPHDQSSCLHKLYSATYEIDIGADNTVWDCFPMFQQSEAVVPHSANSGVNEGKQVALDA